MLSESVVDRGAVEIISPPVIASKVHNDTARGGTSSIPFNKSCALALLHKDTLKPNATFRTDQYNAIRHVVEG